MAAIETLKRKKYFHGHFSFEVVKRSFEALKKLGLEYRHEIFGERNAVEVKGENKEVLERISFQ